ncbi:hypothetical protein B9479_007946 [Cryptococcus floricola]|uniref:Uncharacterized protein n=1 Tax=Cryptococcus floricola TaxID=2591691 RepID=A0A5D3AN42_9TREE|nr:hypothetical protein B9479_007946 [Cryptococcus floricola]
MLQKKDGTALGEGEEGGSGSGEGGEGGRGKEGDNVEGALLGAKAFGIATGIVFGCAGLGMWIVGKAVGAEDPEDFAVKMRQQLVTSMPKLVGSVNRPGRSVDGFDGEAIEEWVEGLEREDERATLVIALPPTLASQLVSQHETRQDVPHLSSRLGVPFSQSLGIATGIVFGCAGLGMWIVGKAVGAEDPEDFAVKMRHQLVTSMPALVTSVNRPGRSVDGFDGEAIEEWVEGLEREDERAT